MGRLATVTNPRLVKAQGRRIEVLKLRQSGMSFKDIAADLVARGIANDTFTLQHAYRDLRIELANMRATTPELREEVRQIELTRLDVMLKKLWDEYETAAISVASGEHGTGEAPGPALWILDRILKIQERRAKYLGLDEPQKHSMTFDDGMLVRVVEKLLGIIQLRITDVAVQALIAQDFSGIDWSSMHTSATVEVAALTAGDDEGD